MEKYERIKVLGEGSFGKVYLMRQKLERKLVCVKVIKIKNIPRKEREAVALEVDLLKRLHHPNIVGYKDSFLTPRKDCLCIAMEYCDGGDLQGELKKAHRRLLPESKVLHWFVQIALGLHYMHSHRVLHRDLKTQNIFLLGNGRLVLGDLGISKVLEGTSDFASTCIGTPYYMSPEIFKNQPYNHKSDVWALGCVLYEMTTLNHAFDASSLNGLAGKIIKGRFPPIHAKYSEHLKCLIGATLATEPARRPDLEEVLTMPFIKRHIQNFLADIVSRDNGSIGEGTMVVKAAAVNMVARAQANGANGRSGAVVPDGAAADVQALKEQLEGLNLQSVVARALVPPQQRPAPTSPGGTARAAREQASALRREEERKKAVEAALARLRQEREDRLRARQQSSLIAPETSARSRNGSLSNGEGNGAAAAAAVAAAGAAPRQPSALRQALAPQQQQQEPLAGDQAGLPPPRRRSFGGGAGVAAAAGAAAPPPPGPPVKGATPEASRAGEAEERRRQRDIEKLKQARDVEKLAAEAARRRDRQPGIDHAREQAAAAAAGSAVASGKDGSREAKVRDDASRREAARARELERQREEQQKLRQYKLELDNKMQERERAREARRQREAAAAAAATGSGKPAAPARGASPAVAESKASAGAFGAAPAQAAASQLRPPALERKGSLPATGAAPVAVAEVASSSAGNEIGPGVSGPSRRRLRSNNGAISGANAAASATGDTEPTDTSSPASVKDRVAVQQRDKASRDGAQRTPGLKDHVRGLSKGSAASNGLKPAAANGRASPVGGRLLDDDSDPLSDSEASVWVPADADGVEVDEVLHAREEELEKELQDATVRCEELRHTLLETKSILDKAANPSAAPNATPRQAAPAAKPSQSNNGPSNGPITAWGPGPGLAPRTVYQNDPGASFGYVDEAEYEDSLEDFEDDSEAESKMDLYGESPLVSEAKSIDFRPPGAKAAWNRAAQPAQQAGPAVQQSPAEEKRRVSPLAEAPFKDMMRDNFVPEAAPQGRLQDRIRVLRQRCVEGLGNDVFRRAYQHLKAADDACAAATASDGAYDEEDIMAGLRAILGRDKLHYYNLLDQLIFIENTHFGDVQT